MSVEGSWRGYYQFEGGQGQPSGKIPFKARFVMKNDTFSGSGVEKNFVPAMINGWVEENAVTFESQIQTTSPPSFYEGKFASDGSLSGTCKLERKGRHYAGTWFAERYQPNPVERFFDIERCIGIVALVVAAASGYFGIWSPIEQARLHAQDEIVIVRQLQVVFAACLPIGIATLIFGHGANEFLEKNLVGEKKTVKGWIILALLLGAMLALFAGVDAQLASLGYAKR